MELAPGEMLGPYRLIERAGAGGMAEVWRAYQPRLDRQVAVKVLPRHLASQPGYVERFEREARAISRLDHPNILTVFDFGEQDGFTYMVTPFVSGGTLAQRLGKPWSVEAALEVIRPLASALDYAHAEGIVHRDVKPANVLMGERGRLVLSDFGVARILEQSHVLTGTGMVIGTPAYMSPEQADGQRTGPASDLYSLGIVLYEMLTGRVPFQAETPLAVVHAHIHKPLPLPRTINPALPEAVESVLLKALAKEPSDRYPGGEALVDGLEHVAPAAPKDEQTVVDAATTVPSPSPPDAPLREAKPASVPWLSVELRGPAAREATPDGGASHRSAPPGSPAVGPRTTSRRPSARWLLAALAPIALVSAILLLTNFRPPASPPFQVTPVAASVVEREPGAGAAPLQTPPQAKPVVSPAVVSRPSPSAVTPSPAPSAAPWQVLAGDRTAPGDFNSPYGVALDGQGNLYVAELGNHRIQKLSPLGQPLARWGTQGSGPGQFHTPGGVVVDAQGNVYVADSFNHRIQKLSPSGQPLAQWGSEGTGPGQFQSPVGVAVDGQGNLYVADWGNHRVQKLSPSGQ